MFFNGDENGCIGWEEISNVEASRILFRDISNQEPNNIKELTEEFKYALEQKLFPWRHLREEFDEIIFWDEKNSPHSFGDWQNNKKVDYDFRTEWDLKDALAEMYFNDHKDEYLDFSNGKVTYVLEYGNDAGCSALESDDVFENVTFIRNSKH